MQQYTYAWSYTLPPIVPTHTERFLASIPEDIQVSTCMTHTQKIQRYTRRLITWYLFSDNDTPMPSIDPVQNISVITMQVYSILCSYIVSHESPILSIHDILQDTYLSTQRRHSSSQKAHIVTDALHLLRMFHVYIWWATQSTIHTTRMRIPFFTVVSSPSSDTFEYTLPTIFPTQYTVFPSIAHVCHDKRHKYGWLFTWIVYLCFPQTTHFHVSDVLKLLCGEYTYTKAAACSQTRKRILRYLKDACVFFEDHLLGTCVFTHPVSQAWHTQNVITRHTWNTVCADTMHIHRADACS